MHHRPYMSRRHHVISFLLLLAIIVACWLLAVATGRADAREQMTARAADDLARAAVFERAINVTLARSSGNSLTDIYGPYCRRRTRQRIVCKYHFTILYKAIPLYEERGRVQVTRTETRLTPTMQAGATRDGWPS